MGSWATPDGAPSTPVETVVLLVSAARRAPVPMISQNSGNRRRNMLLATSSPMTTATMAPARRYPSPTTCFVHWTALPTTSLLKHVSKCRS